MVVVVFLLPASVVLAWLWPDPWPGKAAPNSAPAGCGTTGGGRSALPAAPWASRALRSVRLSRRARLLYDRALDCTVRRPADMHWTTRASAYHSPAPTPAASNAPAATPEARTLPEPRRHATSCPPAPPDQTRSPCASSCTRWPPSPAAARYSRIPRAAPPAARTASGMRWPSWSGSARAAGRPSSARPTAPG